MSATYFSAIRAGQLDVLRALLDADPELLLARDPKTGGTGLHATVQAEGTAAALELIARGADLEARSKEGRTALHDAIEFGREDLREVLLQAGAALDVCAAAILGRLERVRELLDADPTLVNDRSTHLSPLGWAAFGNQPVIAEELIRRGARVDDGEILCAAACGHVEVARTLVQHGVDPGAIDPKCGRNALHEAAAMRYSHDASRFVSFLLGAGVDPRLRSREGRTAREIAEAGLREQQEAGDDVEFPKHFERIVHLLDQAAPN